MPNLPIRDLGAVGVITDQDPFTLPLNAFTRAKNVRFSQGEVTRSPCFREVQSFSNFSYGVPRWMYTLYSTGGFDELIIIDTGFDAFFYSNGSYTGAYNSGAGLSDAPVTMMELANVVYANRPDLAPIAKGPQATSFTTLANWPSTYRCNSLRSFGDFAIALNTVEGGTSFPTRVRFSDIALGNQVPSSWDETDTTKSAGFNDLVQMGTPIVDGLSLGSNFLIYSSDQVWLMEYVGGTFIFNFRKLFDDAGVISQNCITEVNGKHYVFDSDDIYVTDGLSKQSICEGRVRQYIFNGLDNGKKGSCFVHYDSRRDEVYFCYKSNDDMAVYVDDGVDYDGCNRAAVYNVVNDTWSFVDMPNVIVGSEMNVSSSATYDNTTLTYDTAGGTFASQAAGFDRHSVMMGRMMTAQGVNNHFIYALDGIDENSQVSKPIKTEVMQPIKLERVGIDLDELQIPLSGYKNIRKMLPQFSTVASDKTFDVTMGAADLPNATPNYGPTYNFNSDTEHKIDARSAGRYLSYKVTTPTDKDFDISGFDFDIITTGRR